MKLWVISLSLWADLTVITAMLATFSLFLMVMGALCIIMALNKGVQFFLKPASVCFTLSGIVIKLWTILTDDQCLMPDVHRSTLPHLIYEDLFSEIVVLNGKNIWLIDFLLFLVCLKSGLLVFLSLIIFHQSVLSFLASDHSIPLHHELSWSVACMGCAGALLVVAGVLLLLLAVPYSSWGKCLPNRNTASSWHRPFVHFCYW